MWMRFNMCDSEEMTMLRVLLSSLSLSLARRHLPSNRVSTTAEIELLGCKRISLQFPRSPQNLGCNEPKTAAAALGQ